MGLGVLQAEGGLQSAALGLLLTGGGCHELCLGGAMDPEMAEGWLLAR